MSFGLRTADMPPGAGGPPPPRPPARGVSLRKQAKVIVQFTKANYLFTKVECLCLLFVLSPPDSRSTWPVAEGRGCPGKRVPLKSQRCSYGTSLAACRHMFIVCLRTCRKEAEYMLSIAAHRPLSFRGRDFS